LGAIAVTGSLDCTPPKKTAWASIHAEEPSEPVILPEPPATKGRWSWPGSSAFRAREADVRRDAQSIRLVWGRVKNFDGVALAIAPEKDGTFELWVEFTADRDDRYKVHVGHEKGWK